MCLGDYAPSYRCTVYNQIARTSSVFFFSALNCLQRNLPKLLTQLNPSYYINSFNLYSIVKPKDNATHPDEQTQHPPKQLIISQNPMSTPSIPLPPQPPNPTTRPPRRPLPLSQTNPPRPLPLPKGPPRLIHQPHPTTQHPLLSRRHHFPPPISIPRYSRPAENPVSRLLGDAILELECA